MALARAAHMAPDTCINEPLNSPSRAVVILLGPLTLPTIMVVLLVMEGIRDSFDDATSSESSPTLLQGICTPGWTEASVKTITGRRCSLHACIELLLGFHYSQSLHCLLNYLSRASTNLRGGLLGCFPAPPAILSIVQPVAPPPAIPATPLSPGLLRRSPGNMSHLCERMRSRRGLSQGLCRPPPSSFSADDDHELNLSPRGERGRGRGRSGVVVNVSVDAAPPSPSLAHVPGRSSPLPVPPNSA